MTTLVVNHAPEFPLSKASIVAHYTWLVGSATLALALIIAILGPPSDVLAAVIMITAVALIGLPHGAYDLEVARRIFAPRLGRWWWVCFGAGYLAFAFVALGLWAIAPLIALAILLIGGAAHWGLDDLEDVPRNRAATAWLAMSRGAIPVAAPMFFHAEEVSTVFATLLGTPVAASTVQSLGLAWGLIALPGIVASVWWSHGRVNFARLRIIAEPAVLMLWFAAAPPLLAFTMYFCFWHAVRHSLRSTLQAEPVGGLRRALLAYLRAAALPTVLTWLLAAVAAAMFLRDTALTEGIWSATFMGLFALAVPHILLEVIEHRASPKPTHAP